MSLNFEQLIEVEQTARIVCSQLGSTTYELSILLMSQKWGRFEREELGKITKRADELLVLLGQFSMSGGEQFAQCSHDIREALHGMQMPSGLIAHSIQTSFPDSECLENLLAIEIKRMVLEVIVLVEGLLNESQPSPFLLTVQ